MAKTTMIVCSVAVLLVVGGGSFFGGMKYGQSRPSTINRAGGSFANLTPEERQARFPQMGGVGAGAGGRGDGGTRAGGGFVNGEVIGKDDKSITVKLVDGGSKPIFFSSSTVVGTIASGSLADVAVGNQVMASGSANSDGSITAQSIQIRPSQPGEQKQ